MPGCILFIKGDCSEYCPTFGFPNWGSTMIPCLFCSVSQESLSEFAGLSPLTFPHQENDEMDYERAAQRCEVVVTIMAADYEHLKPLLRYDKRNPGSAGLALLSDVDHLRLRKGDRLEPSKELPHVGDVFQLAECPVKLTFWRRAAETIVLHRNPIWDPQLGITPARTLTIDVLHTLHLGIFAAWCKLAVWVLLESSCWASAGGSAEERHRLSILCMRQELDVWFKGRHKQRPDEKLTRVHDITSKMLGTRNDPQLKLSGAETWGVMLYLLWALDNYKNVLSETSRLLRAAGQELESMYTAMQSSRAVARTCPQLPSGLVILGTVAGLNSGGRQPGLNQLL